MQCTQHWIRKRTHCAFTEHGRKSAQGWLWLRWDSKGEGKPVGLLLQFPWILLHALHMFALCQLRGGLQEASYGGAKVHGTSRSISKVFKIWDHPVLQYRYCLFELQDVAAGWLEPQKVDTDDGYIRCLIGSDDNDAPTKGRDSCESISMSTTWWSPVRWFWFWNFPPRCMLSSCLTSDEPELTDPFCPLLTLDSRQPQHNLHRDDRNAQTCQKSLICRAISRQGLNIQATHYVMYLPCRHDGSSGSTIDVVLRVGQSIGTLW